MQRESHLQQSTHSKRLSSSPHHPLILWLTYLSFHQGQTGLNHPSNRIYGKFANISQQKEKNNHNSNGGYQGEPRSGKNDKNKQLAYSDPNHKQFGRTQYNPYRGLSEEKNNYLIERSQGKNSSDHDVFEKDVVQRILMLDLSKEEVVIPEKLPSPRKEQVKWMENNNLIERSQGKENQSSAKGRENHEFVILHSDGRKEISAE